MPKPKSKEIVLEVETSEETILSASEANKLRHCERTVDRFLEDAYAAGEALQIIRDVRLYRATHRSFELYVQERFGYSRPWAYELMGVAEVKKTLSGIPDLAPPVNQAQAVELTVLKEASDQIVVWKKV